MNYCDNLYEKYYLLWKMGINEFEMTVLLRTEEFRFFVEMGLFIKKNN